MKPLRTRLLESRESLNEHVFPGTANRKRRLWLKSPATKH
jgi:hypothetical protein